MSNGPATVWIVWHYAPPPLAPALVALYGDEQLAIRRAAREAVSGRPSRYQWAMVGSEERGPMQIPDVDG